MTLSPQCVPDGYVDNKVALVQVIFLLPVRGNANASKN